MDMHPSARLERVLPGLMDELADARTPDYLEAAIEQASTRPQRPAWTFPERWIPMDIVTTPASSARFPLPAMGILALIALLIAATLIVATGSPELTPAPPFGVAANGAIAYSADSEAGDSKDILAHDPATGTTVAIVSGPENDVEPRYSRDGTQIVFARLQPGDDDLADVMVANADGSDVRTITPAPMALTPSVMAASYTFAPDGSAVAITGYGPDDQASVLVVPTAQGSDHRWYDLADATPGIMAVREPHYRPTDPNTLLVTVDRAAGPEVISLDLDTGATTSIVTGNADAGLDSARWSPDGQSISYVTWSNAASGLSARTHIVNPDGTGDRLLPAPDGMVFDIAAAWSNDASRLLVVRGFTTGWDDTRAAIVPADGSSVGTPIPFEETIQGGCCYAWEWSPDDSQVLGKRITSDGTSGNQVIVDVDSATLSVAPWDVIHVPVWQRLAP